MANKKTPLIQLLRSNSGTVYVFPSASEDIGLNLDADVNGVALTHYALLNIPEIDRKKWLFGHTDIDNPEAGNLVVSKSLQNYMMNFETALINLTNYNFQKLNTVSERVFWHWFSKIGCINTNNLKRIEYNGKVYFCEDSVNDRVVKCFGSIDAGNSLSGEFGVFNETYINIPSSYGSSPIFFTLRFDENYQDNTQIQTQNTNSLEGRSDNISYISYTDNDDVPYGDNINDSSAVVYNINSSANNSFEGIEIVKDITTIQGLMRQLTDNLNISIFSFDELNIDPNNKFVIDNTDSTETSLIANEFNFNAILLYYSVYDITDNIKTAHATNLFGIIFLDGAVDYENTVSTGTSYIPAILKRKTTEKNFGTGYSFRVNTRTMSIYDNSDAVIQDNTTLNSVISNDLSETIGQLNRAIDILSLNHLYTETLRNNYKTILDHYYSQRKDISDISTLLNNYIKGKTVSMIDVEQAYISDFYTNNDTNDFNFYTKTGITNEYNKPVYERILNVNEDGIITDNVNASDVYMQHGWYVISKGFRDPAVLTDVNKIVNNAPVRSDVTAALNVLAKMFDSSSNLVINIAEEYTQLQYLEDLNIEKHYNKLYINEASNIFNANTSETVSWLKHENPGNSLSDSTANIDYVGLIPYIIAQLQRSSSRFKYSYDNNNLMYSLEDIETIKDALDYIFNILNSDNVLGYRGGIKVALYEKGTPIPGTLTLYEKGSVLEQYLEDNTSYFFKGQDVICEFNWEAGEPNNNMLKRILLNERQNTNMINYVTDNPNDEKIKEIAIDTNTGLLYTILDNIVMKSTDNPDNPDIKLDYYYGTYQVISPDKKVKTSITLLGAFTSAAFRELADKQFSSEVKCMVKCYYWYDYTDNTLNNAKFNNIKVNGSENDINTVITNKELLKQLKYFIIEDDVDSLDETYIDPDIDSSKGDAYIYFMLPYREDNLYMNIHIYADFDFGVGGYDIIDSGKVIKVNEFGKDIEYVVYRISQMQQYPINIKIG